MNNTTDNHTSNNNEILFWKVVHNKYIFKKIIHSITENDGHSIESDFYPINDANERIKFKHIYSLEWMIEKKQFQLLKYKLSNDNEYVDIKDGLIPYSCLFSLNPSTCDNDNDDKLNNTSTSTITPELYKEILQLVIKRAKQSFQSSIKQSYPQRSETDRMISIVIKNARLQPIYLLFQCLDDGTTLESKLINSYNKQSKTEFCSYFKSSISDNSDNHALLKIILDIITNQRQQDHGIDKVEDGEEYITTNSNKFKSIEKTISTLKQDDKVEISFYEFMRIKNPIIQNKILDLDILENDSTLIGTISNFISKKLIYDKNNNDSIELLLFVFKIIYRFQLQQPQQFQSLQQQISEYQQQGLDEPLIFKELLKQLNILSESTQLFSVYLSKYNQVIMELLSKSQFHWVALEYSIDHFIPEILYHLNVSDISSMFSSPRREYKPKPKPFVSDNLSRSIEFLKVYLSKESSFTNNYQKFPSDRVWTTIKIIFEIVFEIQDPIQYEQIVNNEIPGIYKDLLPLKWNPLIRQINVYWDAINQSNEGNELLVTKESQIDWMEQWLVKACKRSYSIGKKISLNKRFNFSNFQLSIYASNKLSFIPEFRGSFFYVGPFLKAIVEFDFQTIKYIHSLDIKFPGYEFEKLDYNQQLSNTKLGCASIGATVDIIYQEFKEIIEFIFQNEMVPSYSICGLIGFIVENGYYNDSKYGGNSELEGGNNKENKFDLGKFKINLGIVDDQQLLIEHLHEVCTNYNNFRFILENIKFTKHYTNGTFQFKFDYYKDRSNLIESLIHLLIDQLKQCREIIQTSTNDESQPNLQVYYGFLSSLFNLFPISLNNHLKLEQVYQLLNENQVELELDDQLKLNYIKCKFRILHQYLRLYSISNTPFMMDLSLSPLPQLFKYSFFQLLEMITKCPYSENFYEYELEYCVNDILIFYIKTKRMDLYLKVRELFKPVRYITPNYKLIRVLCINLELNSFTDILDEIDNTINTNSKSKDALVTICSYSLKLGAFEISKLAFNSLIKYSNNNQIPFDDLIFKIPNCDDHINYFIENRYSLLEIIDKWRLNIYSRCEKQPNLDIIHE